MFARSFATLLQGLLVERASSVWIRLHAHHSPAPEHDWVISLGESHERTTVLSLGCAREQQTGCGDIAQLH
jgi:hypothetical protein